MASSEEELVTQVERAIFQLYHDPDSEHKSVADRWLQEVQQSPQTWDLSWTLLQHQSVEVRNFGALMLCSKIEHRWSELAPDDRTVLRARLFQHMARISSTSTGQRLVLVQLSRAMVGVAFHTMGDWWPNAVVSCIHSLKKACQDTPGSQFATAVVQLLTVFPEEFEKMSSGSIALRRGVIKGELVAGLTSVTSLMQDVISQSQDSLTKNNAIKCCNSWIRLSSPLPELQSLSSDLFCCLQQQELLETACDALYDMVSHDDAFKYPSVLYKIMERLLEMKDFMSSKLEDNDMEACENLVRLVEGVAEANVSVLLRLSDSSSARDTENCMLMLQIVLDFLSMPGTYPVDERCSEVTFQFWDTFLDGLSSADPEDSKFLLDFYASPLQSLIEVFPEKAQYPPDKDWEDSWSDDDCDDFVRYRESLCDIAGCLQQTKHVEYLQHLTSLLSSLLSGSQQPAWQPVEALLFLLQGVASNITQQSSYLVQNILCLFPSFPPHSTLLQTALTLIGLLSGWFKRHLSLLQGVLPMILESLTRPSLASCAALAFKDVCGECSNELSTIASQLIPHCQQALSSCHLSSSDCVRLVVAIGSVLSVLPVSALLPPLEALVSGRVESLRSLAEQEPSELSKVELEKELAVLGALSHHVYPTLQEGERHPIFLLLLQLFPVLQSIINHWSSDYDVVESVCILLSHGMVTVGTQYSPLLEQTVELLVKCYAATHHHKLLRCASDLVNVFGGVSSSLPALSTLLQSLHSLSLQLFQSALQDYPDIAQFYLDLIAKALGSCPAVLLSTDGTLASTYDIGLASLKLPEQHTVSSASSYFLLLLPLVSSSPQVAEVISLNGESLVEYLLQGVAWAAPRSYLNYFADVLHALCVHCLSLLSQWLENLLSRDCFPSALVTPDEKQLFKSFILKTQGSKKAIREKTKEFSLKCRGFHGTLYALETT